jgi:methionine-S-sulfoxide reductase
MPDGLRSGTYGFSPVQNSRQRYNIDMKDILGFLMAAIIGGTAMAFAAHEGPASSPPSSRMEKATFAGGCFWCMEPPFEKLKGVLSVTSGYAGGHTENPKYEEVSSGETGHAEAVEVLYDPAQIPYQKLLDVFWRNIDPTTKDRQFVDVGTQYRTAIFYHSEEQKRLAEESKKALEASGRFGKPIVTEIVPAGTFWPAEAYHQDYYKNSATRYKFYRFNSGRDQYLDRIWGKDRDQ